MTTYTLSFLRTEQSLVTAGAKSYKKNVLLINLHSRKKILVIKSMMINAEVTDGGRLDTQLHGVAVLRLVDCIEIAGRCHSE